MKKLTPRRREYYKRIAAKRYRRRLGRIPRRKKEKRKRLLPVSLRSASFDAPETFSLASPDKRDELMRFLKQLRNHVNKNGRAVISFDKTNGLLPCGTLFFVAALDCLLKDHPGRITSNYPKDPIVEQLFQHIGVLTLLGNTSKVAITADNVRYWHFIRGTTGDTSPFKALFSAYSSGLKERIRDGLYESLSEAITNTIQHAYERSNASTTSDPEKRWWMFAQQKDGRLTLVVCDLGIGIPVSLRQKIQDHFRYALGRKRRHTQFIEIAIQSKRSRTNWPHRGKGLPDMFEFVKNSGIGAFIIYSLDGSFIYDAALKNEVGRDFSIGIPGTLIQWEVPLASFDEIT